MTMSKEAINKELLANIDVKLPYHKKYEVTDIVTIPTFNPKYAVVLVDEEKKLVNFFAGDGYILPL